VILRAINLPIGFISYYITRKDGYYYVMYDDRKTGLARIGMSVNLRYCLFVIKYHIRNTKKVAFTTEEIFDFFTTWQLYDFTNVSFEPRKSVEFKDDGNDKDLPF